MTRRALIFFGLSLTLISALIFVGCSDDTTIITTTPGGTQETLSEIEQLFPAQAGYETVYEVTQSNGSSELVTRTVGEEVIFGYTTAYEMHVRSSSGERYTNYFLFTDSSLYFYEYWSDVPEKVLAAPVNIGSSWSKYDGLTLDNQDTTTTDGTGTGDTNETNDVTGGTDPLEPKTGDGEDGVAAKNFPGNDAGLFTIEAVEGLTLSSGQFMSGTIRVRNDGAQMTNYFWFTPGIGLVRWVLDANPQDKYSGTEVGELLEFGIKRY